MLVAPRTPSSVLDGMRTWLIANNATTMTVLLWVIGVQHIGKGIGSF